MKIPIKYKEYFKEFHPLQRKTLEDAQTKLFIRAKNELCLVAVDNGILKNVLPGIRKCDFLVFDKAEKISHLIELKGTIIDAAFDQLQASLDNIANVQGCSFLIDEADIVCSYIVSPNRMNTPRGLKSKERTLAKALASKCKIKPANILDLINYVTVKSKIHAFSKNGQDIICSNAHPLEL